MDYVSGKLFVNPKRLKYVIIVVCSYALGLINACFLCRIFFPFNPHDVSVRCRILRGIIGTIGIVLSVKFIFGYIMMNIVRIRFVILWIFLAGISMTLIYPLIFSKLKN